MRTHGMNYPTSKNKLNAFLEVCEMGAMHTLSFSFLFFSSLQAVSNQWNNNTEKSERSSGYAGLADLCFAEASSILE